MKSSVVSYLMLVFFSQFGNSQDSLKILSFENYMQRVLDHHPVAFQAKIKAESGAAMVKASRGAFDPTAQGNVEQKYFDGSQYYSYINGSLKIPTWFGLSFESGYNLNQGVYLSDENRTPNLGLWYAGVRLELGNGLIIDERRASLEKAKIYRENTEYQRKIMLNQLFRDASIAYFSWRKAHQEWNTQLEAITNAELRQAATKQAAIFGDKASIDTVEASILLQNRQLSFLQAENQVYKTKLKLELFLWEDGFVPLEIDGLIPEMNSVKTGVFQLNNLDSLVQNHPSLLRLQLDLNQEKVNLKLKKEQFKPKLTLKYNALSEPINQDPFNAYIPENYSWGASISYPLFSRKAMGEVEMAKLKIQDQELSLQTGQLYLQNQILEALNNFQTALEQLEIGKRLAENSERLFLSEKTLFELGESSLFMINNRENDFLRSKISLIQLENNLKIQEAELYYHLMMNPVD